jgi:hypothetical protein
MAARQIGRSRGRSIRPGLGEAAAANGTARPAAAARKIERRPFIKGLMVSPKALVMVGNPPPQQISPRISVSDEMMTHETMAWSICTQVNCYLSTFGQFYPLTACLALGKGEFVSPPPVRGI